MDPLMITAASGMRARLESLEMLANNLANTATAGYKSDREFYSLYVAAEALQSSEDGFDRLPATLPVIQSQWTDYSQGTLTPTGNPLDLALSGQGFFVADGPGSLLYTRNGSLRLSSSGVLTTAEGYTVRSVRGTPIRATAGVPLEISTDGAVRQAGQALGQLAVVKFSNPASVGKVGRNYYRAVDPAAAPQPAPATEVHQGKLESSNVGAPESAVRLISILRQFEMLQKAALLGAEMGRRAIEEVARTNA
jgi:flagellar basal body rod protein FlgG